MLDHQLQYAHNKFRALLETSYGDEFERLFHRLMELRHPDYMPIRTHGNLGDLGGDGIRMACRTLYACYAPETFEVSAVRSKFRGDLEKAVINRPEQFDTFVFVHNDQRGGIHPVVSGMLVDAHREFPRTRFQQMGPQKLWHQAIGLDRQQMEELLGAPIPVDRVAYRVGMAEIEPLLRHLAAQRVRDVRVEAIPLPTRHKVDFNELSALGRRMLQAGRPYAHLIDRYYRELLDVRERDEAAAGFRMYYLRVRAECGGDQDEILYRMQRFVLGQELPRLDRDEAAKAVLAYFFDACEIFEIPPPGWEPAA